MGFYGIIKIKMSPINAAIFPSTDYILSGTWIFLSILGIAVQFYLSKNRADFPKSPYCENKRVRKYYSRPSGGTAEERLPILINQSGYNHNEICWLEGARNSQDKK